MSTFFPAEYVASEDFSRFSLPAEKYASVIRGASTHCSNVYVGLTSRGFLSIAFIDNEGDADIHNELSRTEALHLAMILSKYAEAGVLPETMHELIGNPWEGQE